MNTISNLTLRRIGMASLACLAATQAVAQLREGHYGYGGLSVGRTESKPGSAEQVVSALGVGGIVTDFNRDRNGTGYKVYGGWQLDRHFALEGGYFDLGHSGYKANTLPAGSVDAQFKVKGVNLDLVGTLPLGTNFSALGRIGVVGVRTRVRFAQSGAVAMMDASDRSTSAKLGLGLQYAIGSSLLLRGEIDSFRVRDAQGGHVSINMVSLGLVMPFGYGQRATAKAGVPDLGSSQTLSPSFAPATLMTSPPSTEHSSQGGDGTLDAMYGTSAPDCGEPKPGGSAIGCSSAEAALALALALVGAR